MKKRNFFSFLVYPRTTAANRVFWDLKEFLPCLDSVEGCMAFPPLPSFFHLKFFPLLPILSPPPSPTHSFSFPICSLLLPLPFLPFIPPLSLQPSISPSLPPSPFLPCSHTLSYIFSLCMLDGTSKLEQSSSLPWEEHSLPSCIMVD